MGTLHYGNATCDIPFDDRALAHLQIVITAKLRRRESFTFSWSIPVDQGSGRGVIWLDPSSTLYFRYHGSRYPAINGDWIDQLTASASRPGGLFLTDEPAHREKVTTT